MCLPVVCSRVEDSHFALKQNKPKGKLKLKVKKVALYLLAPYNSKRINAACQKNKTDRLAVQCIILEETESWTVIYIASFSYLENNGKQFETMNLHCLFLFIVIWIYSGHVLADNMIGLWRRRFIKLFFSDKVTTGCSFRMTLKDKVKTLEINVHTVPGILSLLILFKQTYLFMKGGGG